MLGQCVTKCMYPAIHPNLHKTAITSIFASHNMQNCLCDLYVMTWVGLKPFIALLSLLYQQIVFTCMYKIECLENMMNVC